MKIQKMINNLKKPGETLSQKVVRSGFWIGFSKIVERALRFVRTIIVARLLSPADFGLFGLSCLALDILQTFTQTGTSAALVQKKDSIDDYLNTAWTMAVMRSFIIFILLFVGAPLVAVFFDNPGAEGVTRAIAFTVLFGGFANIGIIYFTKELDFRKQVLLQMSKILSNTVATIVLAVILKNAWALVWGMLSGSLTSCIMSYVMHPYRPKFHFSWAKMADLFTFGKWVFASSILIFLITQGDDILVGRLLGTTALGLYTMAYAIANLPTTEITHVISYITFPTYAKLQDNVVKLKETYLRIMSLTMCLALPVAGGIFILGGDFVRVVLGDKWLGIIPAMLVLSIQGAMRAFGATTGPLFQGVGKPRIGTKLNIMQFFAMVIVIYPLIVHFGILGAALTITIPGAILLFVVIREVLVIVQCNAREFFNNLFPALLSTIVMGTILYGIKISQAISTLAMLGILSFLGAGIYVVCLYYVDRQFKFNTFAYIKEKMISGTLR